MEDHQAEQIITFVYTFWTSFLAEEWDQFPPLHWLLVAVRFIHEDILRKSNDLDLDYLYI